MNDVLPSTGSYAHSDHVRIITYVFVRVRCTWLEFRNFEVTFWRKLSFCCWVVETLSWKIQYCKLYSFFFQRKRVVFVSQYLNKMQSHTFLINLKERKICQEFCLMFVSLVYIEMYICLFLWIDKTTFQYLS